jgi:signal transduction histidine kinase
MFSWSLSGRPNLFGATDERERHRLELIIAIARGLLSATALLAVYLDPSEPTRYAEVAYNLLVFYELHSAAVLLLLRFGPTSTARLGPVLHAIDLAWAVSITFLTEGPNSSFFALFVFVLLSSATRWGFRETLLTGAVAGSLFLAEAVAAWLGLPIAILDVRSLIMRGAYFLLATFLLAYLSDQAKALRAGASVVSRLTSKINVREGLTTSIRMVLDDLLKLLGSSELVVVLNETATGRVVLWSAVREPSGESTELTTSELEPEHRDDYLFPIRTKVTAWETVRHRGKNDRLKCLALRADGTRVPHGRIALPPTFRDGRWTTVLGLVFEFGQDWNGRAFILDPTARPSGYRRLRFLQAIAMHVMPVLHNVYLLRRLRLRVGALERARVARELHDSVLQSLTSIEMQLDVARRDASLASGPAGELAHIQDLLRHEILNIRDLMEHLRPRVTDAKHLVERLTDLVDRVRRETGIDARCRADIGQADLAPELCHELIRIVQEALINVRKHSGASHVQVHLHVDDWAWKLSVRDNGCGSGFSGTLSHAELASRRVGPRTIRERVEAVGGKLQLRSSPEGLQLEMIGRLRKPWILTPSA